MKTFFKTLAWIISIPLCIAAVFLLFGFLAIRFNFWPPDCSIIPKLEPRRVCEFSKLDKALAGKTASVVFWVTVPEVGAVDKIFLSIAGKEPVEMEKLDAMSFKTTADLTTGEVVKYSYYLNAPANSSAEKEYKVKSLNKKIYDFVPAWGNESAHSNFPAFREVQMKDTWTINYNMNLFEDTRRNLSTSMKRAKEMGATSFGVYSFIEMAGDKDTFTLGEVGSPYKYMRDASIKAGEMKKLAKTAKQYGLKVIIHYNIEADYTQYYNVNIFGPQAGSGEGGNAAEARAGKDFGRDEPKTKEWLDRYFSKLQTVLVKWGSEAQSAGIDAIDITPQYRPPTPAPFYSYADGKMSEIIKAVREVFKGQIYASNFGYYGLIAESSSNPPKYINDVDGLIFYTAPAQVNPGAGLEEIKQASKLTVDKILERFKNYQKPVFVTLSINSYDGFISGKKGMEWGDFAEVERKGYKENWQDQARAYEGMLWALEGEKSIAGVSTAGYWWDDLMAPKYVSTANNMETTIRNKPAEAVWKKWIVSSEN